MQHRPLAGLCLARRNAHLSQRIAANHPGNIAHAAPEWFTSQLTGNSLPPQIMVSQSASVATGEVPNDQQGNPKFSEGVRANGEIFSATPRADCGNSAAS